MGYQKKTGKGRLDKYYHLAKEQGYRARSAFKLVQLNKKYNFLGQARCLVDLCAAPGGWCQVASKYMPTPSLIIGIDLAPIKPLPGVITFQQDITTEKCRQQLREELKTWKVDVFLHDGAPNVGSAWVQDAYSQSELVLMSLKLAVEFLTKGGAFVTKVFRSKDYNNLMWVFQQLFKRVEATKPPSSRNISAEIFVVCRDFIAPKRIDPKFLDPRHVFKDLDVEEGGKQARLVDIFHPEKSKRHREGYEEGDYLLHKKLPIMDFMSAEDPVAILSDVHQLDTRAPKTGEADEQTIEDVALILKHPSTDDDVRECCTDLKVLGKKDFKMLLRWRLEMRKFLKLDAREEAAKKAERLANGEEGEDGEEEEEEEQEEKKTEEEEVIEELERLTKEASRKSKKEKRKVLEARKKNLMRMQLNMQAPTDIGLEQEQGRGEESLFSMMQKKQLGKEGTSELSVIRAPDSLLEGSHEAAYDEITEEQDAEEARMIREKEYLKGFESEEDDAQENEDGEDEDTLMERQLNRMYEKFQRDRAERRDKKLRLAESKEGEPDWKEEPEFTAFAEAKRERDSSDSSSSEEEDEDGMAILSRDVREASGPLPEGEDDEEEIIRMKASARAVSGAKSKKGSSGISQNARIFFDQDVFDGINDGEEEEEEEEEEEKSTTSSRKRKQADLSMEEVESDDEGSQGDYEDGEDEEEVVDEMLWDIEETKAQEREEESKKDFALKTAEAMTMAQALVNRRRSKSSLIDQGFNRYAFHDDKGLPSWFLDDEGRNNKPILPTTKEAAKAIQDRERELNARPIKKVAEAKARKKMRVAQRAEKLAKKQADVVGNSDMTEKEKADLVQKMAKKMGARAASKKREVKVVVAKGTNRGQKGRPKGVKGRYKMVDGRMKKEVRALKRIEKKSGKKRK